MYLPDKRIKAFSLVEMLVVLVLSSIVVSILYLGYYTITTYQVTLARKQQALSDLSTLYFLMHKDIDRCESLGATTSADVMCKAADPSGTIQYSFMENVVLRTQRGVVDTFRCKVGQPSFFWKTKRPENFPARIDEITFTVSLGDSTQFSIFKHYDAASLIETKRDTLP